MTIEELKQRIGEECRCINTIREGISYMLRHPVEMHKKGVLTKEVLLQLQPKERLRDFNIFILEEGECIDPDPSMSSYYVFDGEVLGSVSTNYWEAYLFGNAKAKLSGGGKVHLFDRSSCLTWNEVKLYFCAHDHSYIKGHLLDGECYDESFVDLGNGVIQLHDHSGATTLLGGQLTLYDCSFAVVNSNTALFMEGENTWAIPLGTYVRTRWEDRAHIGEPIVIPAEDKIINQKLKFVQEVEDRGAYFKRHYVPQKLYEPEDCPFYNDFIDDTLSALDPEEHPIVIRNQPLKEATYKDPSLIFEGRCKNIFLNEGGILFEIRDEISADQYVTTMMQYCYYISGIMFDPRHDPEVYLLRDYRCTLFTPEECQYIRILNRQLWALLAKPVDDELDIRDEYGRLLHKQGVPMTEEDWKYDVYDPYEVDDYLSDAEDTLTVDTPAMRDYMLANLCSVNRSWQLAEAIKDM